MVNPIALNSIAWRYYIVYVGILVVICVTVWGFYPETRGRSLEEIAVIFDGEEVALSEDKSRDRFGVVEEWDVGNFDVGREEVK